MDPDNGEVSFRRNSVGEEATFTCDPDYELVGADVIICGDDGQWSPDSPVCKCKTFHLLDILCHWILEQCMSVVVTTI